MAGSRLELIGTIFSRTNGLLRAKAIKYEDRPIWYDIYRVFPPKFEPRADREPELARGMTEEVPSILYSEDVERAQQSKVPRITDKSSTSTGTSSKRPSKFTTVTVDTLLSMYKKAKEEDKPTT